MRNAQCSDAQPSIAGCPSELSSHQATLEPSKVWAKQSFLPFGISEAAWVSNRQWISSNTYSEACQGLCAGQAPLIYADKPWEARSTLAARHCAAPEISPSSGLGTRSCFSVSHRVDRVTDTPQTSRLAGPQAE